MYHTGCSSCIIIKSEPKIDEFWGLRGFSCLEMTNYGPVQFPRAEIKSPFDLLCEMVERRTSLLVSVRFPLRTLTKISSEEGR